MELERDNLREKTQSTPLNAEMMERLYMHHATRLLDEECLTTCQFCNEIYPATRGHKLKCTATHDFFVDNSEEAIQMHVADRYLDLKRLCDHLNEDLSMPWKTIFAKILARSVILPRCSVCQQKPSAAFLQSCNSHPKPACFRAGAHIGVFPCCGKHVIRAAYENRRSAYASTQG